MRILKLIWYDIHGFFHIRKIIRKNKGNVDFQKLNLRSDWVGRIYTVINPSESDKGDSDEVIKVKAQEKMLPVHRYIEKIGLAEYVSVSSEMIPESQSFLLVYYPIIRILSVWRVFVFLLLAAGIVVAWKYIYEIYT